MGITELIVVLLALSGFGVQADPNAPSAQEVAKYAPDSPDVMVHVDAAAVLPGNWKYLTSLPDKPEIKASPTLRDGVTQMVQMAQAGLDQAKGQLGFDPINDFTSATVFANYPAGKGGGHEHMFIAVVRGNFPADVVDKISKMGPHPDDKWVTVDGTKVLVDHDGEVAVARAADGTLLFGTVAWVKERVSKKWKAKAAKKGSLLDRSAAWIDAKPFLLFASAPSANARKFIEQQTGDDPEKAVLHEMLTGHDFSAFAMSATGVSWTWRARDAQGFESAALASDGIIEILRAGHHAVRGFAEIALAAAGPYAKIDPTVADIVKHRAELLKIVFDLSGDGNFTANVDKNAAEKTVTVKAEGKSLSEVFPAGGLVLPAAAGVWLFVGRMKAEAPEPARIEPYQPKPVKPAPAPKPQKHSK